MQDLSNSNRQGNKAGQDDQSAHTQSTSHFAIIVIELASITSKMELLLEQGKITQAAKHKNALTTLLNEIDRYNLEESDRPAEYSQVVSISPNYVEKYIRTANRLLESFEKDYSYDIHQEKLKKSNLEVTRIPLEKLIIGESKSIERLRQEILKVAKWPHSIVISGERGTGKELIAHAIHHESLRTGNFIAFNCASFKGDIGLSALFGHEKGAFTSATATHKGIFECARGGTIFLDEITTLDAAAQENLLRVLECRHFRRLGGNSEIETDARIITATNEDILGAVKDGRFRADLFDRLYSSPIESPALRYHLSDLPLLCEHFFRLRADDIQSVTGDSRVKISNDALTKLASYSWPGNIRELYKVLENALVRMEQNPNVISAKNIYFKEDIFGGGRTHAADFITEALFKLAETYEGQLRAADAIIIEEHLKRNPVIEEAAKAMGINRTTLFKKRRAYGI